MPQGRIVLKSICQSKKLAELKSDGARLLYTWLLTMVDINGCFSGDPEVVKGQVFTRLKKSIKTVSSYIEDLRVVGLIVWYESNGDSFLCIPDFTDKQPSLNADREAKSTIPPPTPEQLQSNSGVTPLKVKERKAKRSKEKEPPTLKEITDYIKEKNYTVDPKVFFDYFTTGNWIDSKGNKVLSWKQKIITWENRQGSNPAPPRGQNGKNAVDKRDFTGQTSQYGQTV